LFDVEQVTTIYGTDSVRKANQVFWFKKDLYKNGLMEKELCLTDVSHTNVLPTQAELDLFRRSGDDLVIEALGAGIVPLQIGDRIEAFTGTFRGLTGHVVDINDNQREISFGYETVGRNESAGTEGATASSTMTVNRVCSWEVHKKFHLGDYVHVLQGAHIGDEGYIVQMDGKDVTIFKRSFVVSKKYGTREEQGVEVSFAAVSGCARS
jgi:transcription elongation factor